MLYQNYFMFIRKSIFYKYLAKPKNEIRYSSWIQNMISYLKMQTFI